ncbi:MAG: SPOR domain-containing protein [Mariprofundaceae bacterium]
MRLFIWMVLLLVLPACHVISVHEYEYIQERNKQSATLIKQNSALEEQVAQLQKEKQMVKRATVSHLPAEKEDPVDKIEPTVVDDSKASAQENHGFYLQLGAFRQQKFARQLLSQLNESWGAARIEVVGKGLHAVRIGPFSSYHQASTQHSLILEEAGFKGFILEKK